MWFNGMQIFINNIVDIITYKTIIAPWPIKKKRKNWTLIKKATIEPRMVRIGDKIFVSQQTYSKLKEQLAKEKGS